MSIGGIPVGTNLTIGTYNTRGLRNLMEKMIENFKSLNILFLSETWIRAQDEDLMEMLDEFVLINGSKRLTRGVRGVGLMINPWIRYDTNANLSTTSEQALVIRVNGITITGMYVSPNAKEREEMYILSQIRKVGRRRAIIIGDLNAERKRWDTRSNKRGRRIIKWAEAQNWTIQARTGATFTIKSRGVSTPDITITKRIATARPLAAPIDIDKGNDHLPLFITITTSPSHKEEKESIPKSQHAQLEICRMAAETIKPLLSKMIDELLKCNSREESERLYEKIGKDIIAPWNAVRRSEPSRYKDG